MTTFDIVKPVGTTTATVSAMFSVADKLKALKSSPRWYNPTSSQIEITNIRAAVGTAPEGSDAVIRLFLEGNLLCSLTIPEGKHLSERITSRFPIDVDQYLVIQLTQVGSRVAGSDLIMQFEY
jgi:hypothetical protein